MPTGYRFISMQIELGKFVPISDKDKFFGTKKACLQKQAAVISFVPGQNVQLLLLGLSGLFIDYKVYAYEIISSQISCAVVKFCNFGQR